LEIQEDGANRNDKRDYYYEMDLFHNLEDDRKRNPKYDQYESNIDNVREEKGNGNQLNKTFKNMEIIQCAKEYAILGIVVTIPAFQCFDHLFVFEKETKANNIDSRQIYVASV